MGDGDLRELMMNAVKLRFAQIARIFYGDIVKAGKYPDIIGPPMTASGHGDGERLFHYFSTFLKNLAGLPA